MLGASSSLLVENFRYRKLTKLSETQKCSSKKYFGTVWQNNFEGRSWYPPFIHKVFPNQIVCQTENDSSRKCFGTVRHNSFDVKSWYAPLFIKSFHTKLFLKPKMIFPQSVSVLWDKTTSSKKSRFSTPLLFYPINLSFAGNFSNTNVFHYEIFRYCVTKQFRRDLLITPFHPKKGFHTWYFWNTEGFFYEVFWYCEAEQFRKKIVINPPPLLHKNFRHHNFSETQNVASSNFFGILRRKTFNGKRW